MVGGDSQRQATPRLLSPAALGVLGEGQANEFAAAARLACRLLALPIAGVRLVREDWGDFAPAAVPAGADLDLCRHVIESPHDLLVVEDARADPRFADTPLVMADPHVRFVCGVELRLPDGRPIGVLFALDTKPRSLSPSDERALPRPRRGRRA